MKNIDPRLPEIDDCLYRLAVKAVVIEDNKLLLVQERDDEWWGLPGGGIDYGETAEEALRRELSEELGIDPQAVQYDGHVLFAAVGAIVNNIPRANLFYRVQVPASEIKPTEHVLAYKWFGADELAGLYMSPTASGTVEQLVAALRASKV